VGSTFTLYLPRVPAAAEAPGAAETAPADGIAPGTETLLLVEDDASVRRTTARALARAGYRVLEAGDGLEALEVLEREPGVDLVVTDVVMPRASGAELYERARERGWTPLFLFTSGYTGADRGGAVLDPSLPFLRKPWTTADLAREVRRVLGRR
jgi:CheY-like chemotaxis protein